MSNLKTSRLLPPMLTPQRPLMLALMLAFSLVSGAAVAAAATVGQAAPTFSATDASGKPVSLADLKGKTVVLEWVNPECPYVRKHYDSANMQATQKAAGG